MYIFTFGSDPQLDVLLRVDVMFMMFCALRNDEIIQNIFVVWHYAESTNSIFKSYTISLILAVFKTVLVSDSS